MLPLRRKPPVTARPSYTLHLAKNAGFLCAAAVFIPFGVAACTLALVYSWIWPPIPAPAPPDGHRLTVMVSGVRATKGLMLAREFARAGYRVVAVEEESQRFACARFSNAIAAFHLLPDPLASQAAYTAALVRIATAERVDLYVPACGVATTICDGLAKPALEAAGCAVLQFGADTGAALDKKDAFMAMCKELGLRVPRTELVRAPGDVLRFDFDTPDVRGKRFLMKCVGVDDRTRNDMTLFPMADKAAMAKRLAELRISAENPYILQEFVQGVEYLSQALVAAGEVLTFTCCESSDLLVNYAPLSPSTSIPALAALEFTRRFAAAHALTGPLAFDFIRGADGELHAIECNPRAHTAIVLFRDAPAHAWARAYAAAGTAERDGGAAARGYLDARGGAPLEPAPGTPSAYWVGHELFDALRYGDARTLLHRLLWEREAHWDARDPLPWAALYALQWPAVFVESLWSGRRWTRINASTGKVFWC